MSLAVEMEDLTSKDSGYQKAVGGSCMNFDAVSAAAKRRAESCEEGVQGN